MQKEAKGIVIEKDRVQYRLNEGVFQFKQPVSKMWHNVLDFDDKTSPP